MDFPITLSTKFVDGLDEFRQDFLLIFKNYVGSFYSSRDLGSMLPEHGSSNLLRQGVQETLKQFQGVTLESFDCAEVGSSVEITLQLRYRDLIEKFVFSV